MDSHSHATISEKEQRRTEKQERWNGVNSMLQQLMDGQEEIKEGMQTKQELCESGREDFAAELRRLNAEQQDLIKNISKSMRKEFRQQGQATVDAIRARDHGHVPFNVQTYLDDFTGSLATEVGRLVGEESRLREERRAMEYEMGFLLTMKSKYGPSGEFEADWKPPNFPSPSHGTAAAVSAAAPPPPPHTEPQVSHAVPSGWRTQRPSRRPNPSRQRRPAPPAPPPPPPPAPSRYIWQPEVTYTSSEDSSTNEPTPAFTSRGSPGLFGSRSPSPLIAPRSHDTVTRRMAHW